jgi:hypothetical protein
MEEVRDSVSYIPPSSTASGITVCIGYEADITGKAEVSVMDLNLYSSMTTRFIKRR